MTDHVLRADGVRIAVDGATCIADLSLATRGVRVVLGGDADPLVSAITGAPPAGSCGDAEPAAAPAQVQVEAGRLELCGQDVGAGRHVAIAGFAPRDPPLPAKWTVAEYLQWGGRLAGLSRRSARDAAAAVLSHLSWDAASRRHLRTLGAAERRVLSIAQARLGEPQVLVCDGPLAGLSEQEAPFVAQALSRACADRAAVVSVARLAPPGPESELVRTATDICVMRAGALLLHAAPSELYGAGLVAELTVRRNGEALSDSLTAQGAVVHGGPVHFAVTLPEGTGLTAVLAAAARANAPVVRCLPLVG